MLSLCYSEGCKRIRHAASIYCPIHRQMHRMFDDWVALLEAIGRDQTPQDARCPKHPALPAMDCMACERIDDHRTHLRDIEEAPVAEDDSDR